MTCTCLPGHPDQACTEPRRHDATGVDPCAHCGTPKTACVHAVMALGLNGCCRPCFLGPRHESEAA